MEADFQAALAILKPLWRAMVIAWREGRTSTEIAAMSGYAPQSVRQILSRAIERMKEYVDSGNYAAILEGRRKSGGSLLKERDSSCRASLPLREARDLLISGLHEAGLGPLALSRLRAEDLAGSRVLVSQRVHPLEREVVEELREWIARTNRRSGYLFAGPGASSKPITGGRVGQILRQQARKRSQL